MIIRIGDVKVRNATQSPVWTQDLLEECHKGLDREWEIKELRFKLHTTRMDNSEAASLHARITEAEILWHKARDFWKLAEASAPNFRRVWEEFKNARDPAIKAKERAYRESVDKAICIDRGWTIASEPHTKGDQS